ncbi:MAG: hypothetical protein L0Y56_22915 [Nitrospira sp.]|nr:hypothetical protein [Nitrospira sp.]
MKKDVAEGFRILREEILAIFNKTLTGAERTKMRWALRQVESALQERYQEVGEKVCQHFIRGEDRITEKDVEGSFKEIERLEIERQRILEEIKDREE